ncbi:MAG TPA: carboxypeptidase regulatory-like domain-containing protein [Longimicrobiales bacterium]|nr:carboxypeptidase regulatory-like domain-containing protein [Longimicrobiales bacterium]
MKPVYWLTLVAVVALPAVARAQVIRGVVIDEETDTPIAAAAVQLLDRSGNVVAAAMSNSAGTFLISTNRTGPHYIRAIHVAYQEMAPASLELRLNESTVLILKLGRAVHPIEPMVVVGRARGQVAAFRERARHGAFGRFITREELEARPMATGPELLRGLAGVSVVQAGTSGHLIYMNRQNGGCLPTIYIDGVMVDQSMGPLDSWTRAEVLEGIEIYPGGIGAPYPLMEKRVGSKPGCGVIAFWTREYEGDGGPVRLGRLAKGVGSFVLVTGLLRAIVH